MSAAFSQLAGGKLEGSPADCGGKKRALRATERTEKTGLGSFAAENLVAFQTSQSLGESSWRIWKNEKATLLGEFSTGATETRAYAFFMKFFIAARLPESAWK